MNVMFSKKADDMNSKEVWLVRWAIDNPGLGYLLDYNHTTQKYTLYSPFLTNDNNLYERGV